ncbi:MAG: hypothetical protein LUE26_06485 [Alistipes sp.]|nr:hypothetical protein [Alistipes sp.]
MEIEKTEIITLLEDLNRNGSEDAMERLYALYYPRLHRYISIFVKDKDPVEELVSDVFLAVWNNRKKILYPSAFTTYIYTE